MMVGWAVGSSNIMEHQCWSYLGQCSLLCCCRVVSNVHGMLDQSTAGMVKALRRKLAGTVQGVAQDDAGTCSSVVSHTWAVKL